MKKTYIDKFFSREYLTKMDIQKYGVYYNVPIENIKKEKLDELYIEEDDETALLDGNSIYDFDYLDSYDDIEYEYTDESDIEYFLSELMDSKKYSRFLVVAFNCTWNGASGYSFKDDYIDCFVRNYDSTMYITGSSRSGKYLELRESHHDVPMGHTTIVIGLTDSEYEKLENKDVEYIINYGKECLNKIIDLEV